jgi:hypothetical protein
MAELLHATPLKLSRNQPVAKVPSKPVGEWTYGDAEQAVRSRLPHDFHRMRDYAVHHDQLRGGAEWIGPGDAYTDDRIQKQFTTDDFTGDAIRNIGDAFEEPQLGFAGINTPPGVSLDDSLIQERDKLISLISDWWDKRTLHAHSLTCVKTSAWAGHAGIRIRVPQRFTVPAANKQVEFRATTDFSTALSYIFIETPDPDKAAIVVHPETFDKISIVLVETTNANGTCLKSAEICYLEPDRITPDEETATTVRYVNSDGSVATSVKLNLGGRLLYAEMNTETLLTPPVLETQQQANFFASIVTRIGESGAFRDVYVSNAKPFGSRYLWDGESSLPPDAVLERDVEMREWVVVPQVRTLGSSHQTELVGLERSSEQTNATVGYETPQVFIAEPVDPMPYVNAGEAIRRRGLRMCAQGHLAQTSVAEASGFAYEQSRARFEKDLNGRGQAEEGMLRDGISAVIALGEHIIRQPGLYTKKFRTTIDQRINAGPRSPDAIRLDMEAYTAGLLSEDTAMARIGVEDTDAEKQRLFKSPQRILKMLTDATTLVQAFTAKAVIRLLGVLKVEKAVVTALTEQAGDKPPPPPIIAPANGPPPNNRPGTPPGVPGNPPPPNT